MCSPSFVSRLSCALVAAFALLVVVAPARAQTDGGAGSAAGSAAATGEPAAAPADRGPPTVLPTAAPTAPAADPVPALPPVPAAGGPSDHSMRAMCQQELANDHAFMKIACEDELAKDKAWFNDLKARLSAQINRNVHTDAANYATQNNKHVVAAYAVFWVLTAGFVLLMWRRQRALTAEVERLERELARALKEGGAA
jgi:CcmD family protein